MSKTPDKKRFGDLSEKWLTGIITKAEREEYDRWYSSIQDHKIDNLTVSDLTQLQSRIYQAIQKSERLGNRPVIIQIPILKPIALIAASVCFSIIAASLFYNIIQKNKESQELLYCAVVPGRDRAILSLDNGVVFDLNSYGEDESSTVALLEGKVKVSLSSSEFKVLKPSEQTIAQGGALEVFPVDLSEAVAWKNGEFMFHNEKCGAKSG